jgi:hypothetical protein
MNKNSLVRSMNSELNSVRLADEYWFKTGLRPAALASNVKRKQRSKLFPHLNSIPS